MRSRRFRRLLVFVVLGALALCLLAASASALSNLGLPTRSSVLDRLSELDKARLAETVHLRQAAGDAVWPGWGAADIPVILYNEGYAFLVGYPDPPPGWVKVPGTATRGGPWELVPDDTLAGQPYYRQSLPDPGVTPQAFVVKVGERWVASMTAYEWTGIKLRAEMRDALPAPLAPLVPYRLVVGVFNSDWHIAAVLHESFHALEGQLAPDRLAAAERANQAGDDYPWDDGALRDAWRAELNTLAQAMQAQTDAEAAELVAAFLAGRADRRAEHALDAALVDFERQREWLEGLAKYAELESWRQGATAAGYAPLPETSADPAFDAYAGFDQRWSSEIITLRNQVNQAGEGRFYYTGWAQAVLLDRLLPGWKARAFNDGVWLEALLSEAVGQGTD